MVPRPPVISVIVVGISVIVVGRSSERHERGGDDRRGGGDGGARHAKRPRERKWRARRIIILRLGCREWHRGEPGGECGRNRNLADTHGFLPVERADHDKYGESASGAHGAK